MSNVKSVERRGTKITEVQQLKFTNKYPRPSKILKCVGETNKCDDRTDKRTNEQQKSYIPQSFVGGCIQILSKINIRNLKKTYISYKSTFFPFSFKKNPQFFFLVLQNRTIGFEMKSLQCWVFLTPVYLGKNNGKTLRQICRHTTE